MTDRKKVAGKAGQQHADISESLALLAQYLPDWYEANKRTLPWRGTGNPYHVWLSEIMLQQTRVEAVKGYFLRFLEALPDIESLAACPDEKLMKLWEGLGYYSRVRNLKKAAQLLVAEYGGKLPADEKTLLKLPGIGSYTAGAIASIAYGQAVPAVDGNVLRVCMRVSGCDADIALPETKKWLEQQLAAHIPADRPGVFTQALMELGAIVCVPNGQPLCERCPLAAQCAARLENRIQELPRKSPKKARKIEEKTVLLIQNGDRFMIQKRPAGGLLAGLWELPSLDGDLKQEEVLAALKQMGFAPLYLEPLSRAKHIFTHIEWHMRGYLVKLPEDTESTACFATVEELQAQYALPSAFRVYLKTIQYQSAAERERASASPSLRHTVQSMVM